ncbi:hypothetical protein GCM10022226_09180 [Sphaerisporangium flaviroseum]|uniref:Uncharacterized protein n=1 Tax=Sphaerisporangium flaviroseum TaxID=509199 RepID=A0ABP7HHV4_9ACTN
MRTSLNIRGALAVAVVAAGASWLGTGSAVAEAPCQSGPPATLGSVGAPYACEELADLPAPYAPGHGRYSGGDPLIGIEHIGRSSGLPSNTTTVIGLADLPAIEYSTDLPYLVNDYPVTHGGVMRYDDRPAPRGAAYSDVPDAPALDAAPVIPSASVDAHAVPAPAAEPAKPSDAVTADVQKLPSVDTTLTGVRVR